MKSILGSLLVFGASAVYAANHVVVVAQNKTLTYTPNQLTADVNDTITFQFVGGVISLFSHFMTLANVN